MVLRPEQEFAERLVSCKRDGAARYGRNGEQPTQLPALTKRDLDSRCIAAITGASDNVVATRTARGPRRHGPATDPATEGSDGTP